MELVQENRKPSGFPAIAGFPKNSYDAGGNPDG
jgi:hypothetical protein